MDVKVRNGCVSTEKKQLVRQYRDPSTVTKVQEGILKPKESKSEGNFSRKERCLLDTLEKPLNSAQEVDTAREDDIIFLYSTQDSRRTTISPSCGTRHTTKKQKSTTRLVESSLEYSSQQASSKPFKSLKNLAIVPPTTTGIFRQKNRTEQQVDNLFKHSQPFSNSTHSCANLATLTPINPVIAGKSQNPSTETLQSSPRYSYAQLFSNSTPDSKNFTASALITNGTRDGARNSVDYCGNCSYPQLFPLSAQGRENFATISPINTLTASEDQNRTKNLVEYCPNCSHPQPFADSTPGRKNLATLSTTSTQIANNDQNGVKSPVDYCPNSSYLPLFPNFIPGRKNLATVLPICRVTANEEQNGTRYVVNHCSTCSCPQQLAMIPHSEHLATILTSAQLGNDDQNGIKSVVDYCPICSSNFLLTANKEQNSTIPVVDYCHNCLYPQLFANSTPIPENLATLSPISTVIANKEPNGTGQLVHHCRNCLYPQQFPNSTADCENVATMSPIGTRIANDNQDGVDGLVDYCHNRSYPQQLAKSTPGRKNIGVIAPRASVIRHREQHGTMSQVDNYPCYPYVQPLANSTQSHANLATKSPINTIITNSPEIADITSQTGTNIRTENQKARDLVDLNLRYFSEQLSTNFAPNFKTRTIVSPTINVIEDRKQNSTADLIDSHPFNSYGQLIPNSAQNCKDLAITSPTRTAIENEGRELVEYNPPLSEPSAYYTQDCQTLAILPATSTVVYTKSEPVTSELVTYHPHHSSEELDNISDSAELLKSLIKTEVTDDTDEEIKYSASDNRHLEDDKALINEPDEKNVIRPKSDTFDTEHRTEFKPSNEFETENFESGKHPAEDFPKTVGKTRLIRKPNGDYMIKPVSNTIDDTNVMSVKFHPFGSKTDWNQKHRASNFYNIRDATDPVSESDQDVMTPQPLPRSFGETNDVQLKRAWVVLEDIFPKNATRHINDKSCACIYCSGSFKLKSERRNDLEISSHRVTKCSETRNTETFHHQFKKRLRENHDLETIAHRFDSEELDSVELSPQFERIAGQTDSGSTHRLRQRVEDHDHYRCVFCPFKHKSSQAMKRHSTMTHGWHLCTACSATFSNRAELQRHENLHLPANLLTCHRCGKRLCNQYSLSHHMRTVHSAQRPFSCGLCSAKSKTKDALKTHISTHLRGKFACPLCPHQFARRKFLQAHLETHAAPSSTPKSSEEFEKVDSAVVNAISNYVFPEDDTVFQFLD